MTGLRVARSAVMLAALAACDSPLGVRNSNNPDVARAFATPAGIQQVISASYQQVHQGLHGASDAINPQSMTMAFENYASVANFGMSLRGGLPRVPIDNNRGNATFVGNFRDYSQLQRASRNAADGVRALDRLVAGGGTLGNPGADNRGVDARARAFGFFVNGIALGFTSMVYDSAAIVTPSVPSDVVPPLSGALQVNAAALQLLDSAVAIANAVPAAAVSSFTLPNSWIRLTTPTRDQFVQIVRSYSARFRAGVARDTTQRRNVAAGGVVDWARVRDDALAGITADLNVNLDQTAGWTNSWLNQKAAYAGWHQVPQFIIGMADTTGAYTTWLNTGLNARLPFVIRTPDTRFPAGADRAAQTAVYSVDNAPPPAGLYFRNRPGGQDTPGDAWGNSFYDHVRFRSLRLNAQANTNWPTFTVAENRLLLAEAYIRLGNVAAAIPLINVSRQAFGLPAIPAGAALADPVPGGSGCAPRTPVPSGSTYTTVCANVLEALKYEKRIETMYSGYAQWYIDGRGWGDLAAATPVEWPVPYQEMDARLKPFYNSLRLSTRGTYGF